ncbi:MAG: hypothetical protein H6R00_1433 [Proteobacteria bacterium]|nr:hypothetical protein [Pseudomonadota bacterium]
MIQEQRRSVKRGMRNLATIQTRMISVTPANRTQAVSRYARLEHERMRIQRELEAWNARKLEAERMLAKADAELAAMRDFLLGTAAAGTSVPPLHIVLPKGREALRRSSVSSALIEY